MNNLYALAIAWLSSEDTYGERYTFYAADGETPIASVTGTAQYLMAIHIVSQLNYGHGRFYWVKYYQHFRVARPNVAPLLHRERYWPTHNRVLR